jgi:hypothetical protein
MEVMRVNYPSSGKEENPARDYTKSFCVRRAAAACS